MTISFSIRQDLFLLNHPFYQAWMEGKLSKEVLQDYACQYYRHVDAFPSYLANALGQCDNDRYRAILAENLAEEDGTAYGTSHPELWLRFAEGLGTSREAVKSAEPRKGIRDVVRTFKTYSGSSIPEALGSLYAYESQVPEIAHSKIEGLKTRYDIRDERTLAFFEVHKTADVEHRESILQLIEALSPDEKLAARRAADESCQVLWDFLTDVATVGHVC